MTNQTPPAWATIAAHDIDSGYFGPSNSQSIERVNNYACIISSHAPDAEALAEALEWLVAINARHEKGQNWETCMLQSRNALREYRARFPKVTP